jgi:hypothetical protein
MNHSKVRPSRWEAPVIAEISALPSALGHCGGGGTAIGPSCGNGQDTGGGTGHTCLSGGVAIGTCSTGSTGAP